MQKNLSHNIEQYILNRLDKETANFVSLRRKELAEMFECVPSQINYVLRSRFSPEHGYIIDSRRGEHGYIKIVKVLCITPEEKAKHLEGIIGKSISLKEAHRLLSILESRELITQRERHIMELSLRHLDMLTEEAHPEQRWKMTADLLKHMLRGLMLLNDEELEYEDEQ